jgi:hypothetical protein
MDAEPLVAKVIGHQLLSSEDVLVRTRAIRIAQRRPLAFGAPLLEALIDHPRFKDVPPAYEIPEGDLGSAALHAYAMAVQPGDEAAIAQLRLQLSLPRALWAVPAMCRLDPLWMLSAAPSWFDAGGNRLSLALDWLESAEDRATLVSIARTSSPVMAAGAVLRSNLSRAEKAALLAQLG